MAVYAHECKNCHRTFTNNSNADLFCSEECREAFRIHELKNWEEKVKKAHRPIIDIAKEATRVGMTYGEYVARYLTNH